MMDVDRIRERHLLLLPVLDERALRLWAAAEAESLGVGGTAIVTEATGIRRKRIRAGRLELAELTGNPPGDRPRQQRVRRPGAGRKPVTETDPTLLSDLESLVDPLTRGDPESALRWTAKSTRTLAQELGRMGHSVGARTVAALLQTLDYSLQATRKMSEGSQNPDRNAQFEHINAQAEAFQAREQPVISVDAKKKELVGPYKNAGREWNPKGRPEEVLVYDFIDKDLGKVTPYGVYDIGRNEGWVNVGIDHDTGEFAVASIERWWRDMGRKVYQHATELLITADGGGSNGARNRLWKVSLQDFADRTGLTVTVCHLPPGTSKWNKIEHRLFSQVSRNWRGRPLVSHEVIVNLIGSTKTTTGLKVRSKLDKRRYLDGIKIPDKQMKTLALIRDDFHGEWNYTLVPRHE
jgi:hypothetical protein